MKYYACLCLCRNPVAVKRPSSAVKQQRKESPGLQHRGAGPGGRGQANPKPDRPGFKDARGTKAKDDKVSPQHLIERGNLKSVPVWVLLSSSFFIRERRRPETHQGT